MPKCFRGDKVLWTISKKTINKIYYDNLMYKKYEYAGKLLFYDSENCNNGVCDKNFKNIVLSKGNKDSVVTPLSVINFHTHPISCYEQEDVKWGWPSGEDMERCIKFAKNGNLVHIVFSKEGTYVIKVLNSEKLTQKTINFIEKILKTTHNYRSNNNKAKLKQDFYVTLLRPINFEQQSNSLLQWLLFVNELTTNNLVTLSNGKLNLIGTNEKIFEVTLINKNKNVVFYQDYVQEECSL